jgi:hypothetical protein
MRLKIVLLMSLILLSHSSFSQAMWILIFGDKLSNDFMKSGVTVSLAAVDYYNLKNAQISPNWALGGFTELYLFKNKSLIFAFDFTFKSPFGAKNTCDIFDDIIDDSITLKRESLSLNNTAFTLPLYLKYKTRLVAFGVGMQMSLIYKATLKYTARTQKNIDIRISQNVNKKVKKFDVGPFVMFEFFIKPNAPYESLRVGLRYFYGLLTPFKVETSAHNATFMATLGIPIGGKSK